MPLTVHIALLLALLSPQIAFGAAQPQGEAQPVALAFELLDPSGNAVTQDDFPSRLRLVFFGFSSCPHICPLTLQKVSSALRSAEFDAGSVQVLFVSIDPVRDTPERLESYTRGFHASVTGLTGSWQQLTDLADRLHVTFGHTAVNAGGQKRRLSATEYAALAPDAVYQPFHSSQLYVFGADNRLLDIIGYGSSAGQIEATLRKHLN